MPPKKKKKPLWPIGVLICKKFDPNPAIDFAGGWFEGSVTEFDAETGFYKVSYEDGDQEEMEAHEVRTWLRNNEVSSSKSSHARKEEDINTNEEEEDTNSTARYSRRKRAKINYQELMEVDEDVMLVDNDSFSEKLEDEESASEEETVVVKKSVGSGKSNKATRVPQAEAFKVCRVLPCISAVIVE